MANNPLDGPADDFLEQILGFPAYATTETNLAGNDGSLVGAATPMMLHLSSGDGSHHLVGGGGGEGGGGFHGTVFPLGLSLDKGKPGFMKVDKALGSGNRFCGDAVDGRASSSSGKNPEGTVSFEHRNLKGLNRFILGSVTTSNFLNPQDDLSFKLDYVHPYLDGLYNPHNRTFRTSCFNSRKLSPVFTGGPGVDEVPPIWVDRAGVKANITENFTRQSKFTYGLVMEEITTRDESNHISPNGQRVLPSGGISVDGPPTTLSGTGIDRLAFAQANITRDNTKFINGVIIGERNVFQVLLGKLCNSVLLAHASP